MNIQEESSPDTKSSGREIPQPSSTFELFQPDEVQMKSPKLAWVDKHLASTSRCHITEENQYPWCAWLPDNDECGMPLDEGRCGYGMTEEEALRDLGVKHNIKLWNEEES